MKIYFALFIAVITTLFSTAQITLGTADFSHAGDTFTVSLANPFTGMNPTVTGANYTWDFSRLDSTTTGQTVDSFITVAQTGSSLYPLYFFDNAFNSHRANQAQRSPGAFTIDTISVSDMYNFYYNGSAGFQQAGIGLTLNGFTAPLGYTPIEMIYKFPLQFGNADSSFPAYSLPLTGVFYLGVNRRRYNEVDGWGTLITPYDTFQVLRMKSTIYEHDSLYLDTLGIGFGFDQPSIIQYKWLAQGKGMPVLQINTQLGIVTDIRYLGYPVCPSLNPSFRSADTKLIVGNSLEFTNTTNGDYRFDWTINGDTISSSKDASYKFDEVGNYVVTLIASKLGCVESTSMTITVFPEPSFEPDLTLYPNPAPGDFTVRCTVPVTSDIKIEVYDLLGHQLSVKEWKALPKGEYHFPVNMSIAQLSASYYYVKMYWKYGDIIKPLVVTKPF